MSKVYDYYTSIGEIHEQYDEPDVKMKMCDGDCGNVYNFEDLYSTCYTQDFCKDCMCTFLVEQEDCSVHDAITGER